MAVSPQYSFHKIGEPLVTNLLEFCVNKGIYTVETTSTECQYPKRELLLKMGLVIFAVIVVIVFDCIFPFR